VKVSDLRAAPYNPRTISAEALQALQVSLGEFGDVSGIVWNRRTKHLVAGHQRLDALKKKHGDKLTIKDGALVAPGGVRFPIRVVNWPLEKEQAANLAANSPFLGGSFDPGGLEQVLRDLNGADGLGSLVGDLRLAELLPGVGDPLPEANGGGNGKANKAEDDVPAGDAEWLTFSCPLTAAQHATVMQAVRLAKGQGCDKVGDCLHRIASEFVKEHEA
jgi:hypothetical protein